MELEELGGVDADHYGTFATFNNVNLWPWSVAGLDAGVGSAGDSRYWVEPMELTMVILYAS